MGEDGGEDMKMEYKIVKNIFINLFYQIQIQI